VNEDATVEEFAGFEPVGATAHRRDSYQQAVHADHGAIDKLYADVVLADQVNVEEDLGVTASAALEEIPQSILDIVAEQEEEQPADDALKEPDLPTETAGKDTLDLAQSLETSLEEILECEKEGSGTGESSTRADILDNGSEDLNVEDSPETSRRSSASG